MRWISSCVTPSRQADTAPPKNSLRNSSRPSARQDGERNIFGFRPRSWACSRRRFPKRLAHEISAPQIEAWLNSRGESLRTRRNYQNDVRNLFNFAIRRGYVASNPVDRLEKIILDEKPVEILTIEQAARLLEAAEVSGGMMTPFIAVGLFAGLRTREIAVLDWKDVDLAEKTITVHAVKTKTRARRIVEISDNLGAWLLPYSSKAGRGSARPLSAKVSRIPAGAQESTHGRAMQ